MEIQGSGRSKSLSEAIWATGSASRWGKGFVGGTGKLIAACATLRQLPPRRAHFQLGHIRGRVPFCGLSAIEATSGGRFGSGSQQLGEMSRGRSAMGSWQSRRIALNLQALGHGRMLNASDCISWLHRLATIAPDRGRRLPLTRRVLHVISQDVVDVGLDKPGIMLVNLKAIRF